MIENIGFENVRITDSFWCRKQTNNRTVTANNVYKRFYDTGRIEAFKCENTTSLEKQPHFFWDSDVAKWIEAVAYITQQKQVPELEAKVDEVISYIINNQGEDGYFNIYFTSVEPDNRFKFREKHELYCAGHLLEAGIAYKEATGKDALYLAMKKYVDYIDRVFRIEGSAAFCTPGHQELEMALVRLYRASGEEKYLKLAEWFIDVRGTGKETAVHVEDPSYSQDHLPVREQKKAEGHAVRLLYMCCAMADIAFETDDNELLDSCEKIFDDIVNKKMYISGGIGSNCNTEGFDEPYYLPNDTAYNETCASIAMAMFAMRMQRLSNSSVYADIVEREIYNGILSGVSLDGKSFFYENPLEIILSVRNQIGGWKKKVYHPLTQRVEVFECSCCPPNILRFIASIGNFIYTKDGEIIRVNQYIDSEAKIGVCTLIQKTEYPRAGRVEFFCLGRVNKIGFRIPFGCKNFDVRVNGQHAIYDINDGYFYVVLSSGDRVVIDFDIGVKYWRADSRVSDNAGRVALMRGPVLYCLERSSNPSLIDGKIPLRSIRVVGEEPILKYRAGAEFPIMSVFCEWETYEKGALYNCDVRRTVREYLDFIPYHEFANNGESDMIVWVMN